MSKDLMRYDVIVEEALRSVVKRSLETAAENGLPGNHHFYITFRTDFPGVDIPEFLTERYPEEMTIVLQFQFKALQVDPDKFSVTLTFNNVPERLIIPLDAITVFADPSVNFALQFQFEESGDDEEPDEESETEGDATGEDKKPAEKTTGEVVSLDQFRRK